MTYTNGTPIVCENGHYIATCMVDIIPGHIAHGDDFVNFVSWVPPFKDGERQMVRCPACLTRFLALNKDGTCAVHTPHGWLPKEEF